MSWAFDDSVTPPFLIELTEASSDYDHEIVELTEIVVDRILDSYPGEQITDDQIREMIRSGMMYGWQFAQQTGAVEHTMANKKAAVTRKKKANARHEKFRTAWEAALAAGREISIAELAREMGFSRASAYRAVHG